MNLVWVRRHDNTLAPQKWDVNPSVMTQSHTKEVVAVVIPIPPEDNNLTVAQLVDKHGYPR